MSQSSFPLYSSLKQKSETDNLTLSYEDQMNICNSINKDLDAEGVEVLYALIKYYSILEDKLPHDAIPYKPKINKGGVKFDISAMPHKLACMIKYFMDLHTQKIQKMSLMYWQIIHRKLILL